MDSFSNRVGTERAPAAATVRVACAVSADERRLFLGGAEAAFATLPVAPVWLESGHGSLAAQLRELNPTVVLTGWSTGALPAEWLAADDCALRYVCHLTGSVRGVVPRAFLERGGAVTNWGDIPSVAVAEQALLLALAALRNLPAWPEAARYIDDTPRRIATLGTRSLAGRRVGLHGFGRIARALVPLLRPFGGAISAYSAGVPEELVRAAGVTPCASLAELFATSEIVFECESLLPTTTGSVSAALLASLPDGAVFVNIARGQIVDEAALLAEAQSGRIRIALDVLAGRPWEKSAEPFRAAGAVVSPHIGGPTFDQYRPCGELALRNIARFCRGEPLEAPISLAAYDRST